MFCIFLRISKGFEISDIDFYQQWGQDKVHFKDEKKFVKVFGFGFNLWTKHDSAKFTAELFLKSWIEDSPHFIIKSEILNQGYIHIHDEMQVVLDESYVQSSTCSKSEKCRFETRNKHKLDRHEKACSDKTVIRYKQKCFGNQNTVRKELIEEGIICPDDSSHKRFISFDIESLNVTDSKRAYSKTILHGVQKVVSIGYYANFGDYKDVIVRKDMTNDSGLKLVKTFLEKMKELQTRHFEKIPSKLKDEFTRCKEELKKDSLSVEMRSRYGKRLWYIKSIMCLKIVGFNSSGYDLPVLLNAIIEVVGPGNIRIIKKGNSIFDLRVDMLCFRDCMNYRRGL